MSGTGRVDQRNGGRLFLASLVLLSTFIAGCSTRLIYHHLDSVALWYIGSLVSLDDEQEATLQQSLSRALDWHRHSELSQYAQFLRDFASRASNQIDRPTLEEASSQVEYFWHAILARVAPDGVKLLSSLRTDQVGEFMTALEKKDRERRDEALARSAQEQTERREKSLIKQLTRWLGSLDDRQKAIIKRAAASMPAETDDGFESRQLWRSQVRDTLLSDESAKDQRLLNLLEHPERSWTESHRQRNEEEKQRFINMLAELDSTLSAQQRQTASRKLIDFASQLEALQ